MINFETADTNMTFYGYEVIQNEKDRGHSCGQTADSPIHRPLVYVRCLSHVRIFYRQICPVSVRYLSASILSAVRVLSGFLKKTLRCMSVRPDKDKTELSGLSLSLSADVCYVPEFKIIKWFLRSR